MSKKLSTLITTLVTASGTIASAFVAFFQPSMYGAIIAAIGIFAIAVNDILVLFTRED